MYFNHKLFHVIMIMIVKFSLEVILADFVKNTLKEVQKLLLL